MVVLEEAEPVEHVGGAGDELIAEAPYVVVPDAHGLVLLLAGLLEGAHAVRTVVLKLEKRKVDIFKKKRKFVFGSKKREYFES